MSSFEQAEIPLTRMQEGHGLSDVLRISKKDIFLNFNCHAIGTVKAFNATNQTVQVTINYSRVFYNKNPDGTYSDVLVPYPVLMELPIITMTGGKFALTMPIKSGDTCLVLFNDRNFADWFASGNTGLAPASGALHSIGDGIALVGLHSAVSAIPDFDTTRAVLRSSKTDGTVSAQVAVGDTLIKIANNTQDLKTLLQNLCTQLNTLCTDIEALTVPVPALGVSGVPVNAAAFAAVATQINTISTNIGSLLE